MILAALLFLAALATCAAVVAKGQREQVTEPNATKRARMIDDLVWGNTSWINHAEGTHEAPEAGIARLHRQLGRNR